MNKIKLWFFGFLLVCVSLVFISTIELEAQESVHSNVSATTVWYEQTFWEAFWGDGIHQLRRKFTATAGSEVGSRVYENRELLLVVSNTKNVSINKTYTETIRVGFSVSETLKSKSEFFEAEVGYTFNYEVVTSESTSITIYPYESAEVWESDVRILYQYVSVKVVEERSSWFGTWVPTGDYWYESERIREYSGNYIEIL